MKENDYIPVALRMLNNIVGDNDVKVLDSIINAKNGLFKHRKDCVQRVSRDVI